MRAIEQEAPTSKSLIKWWEHVTKTQDKINEGVGSYDVSAEYGISEDYYKSIIEKMNIQYENAMSEVNGKDFRFVELNSASSETNITSPLLEGKNTVVLEENGWKNTAEILKKYLNWKVTISFILSSMTKNGLIMISV